MTRRIALAADDPDPDITAIVVKVTPEVAEKWLGKNVHNRNVRPRTVDSYARDMAAGQWQITGEAIKFASNGDLLDGQHRLLAVIQSGVTIEMLVVSGLDPAAQEAMDSGTARTTGDALRLRGETAHYSALAAAARVCIYAEAGQSLDPGGQRRITTPEVLTFIEANSDLRAAVEMGSSYHRQIDMPQSVLAYAIWRFARVDVEACNTFIAKVAEKTLMTKGDPVLALVNRLAEVRRNSRRVTRDDYASLMFRAWNYWRKGRPIQALPISTGPRPGDADRDANARRRIPVAIPEPE